MEIVIYGEPVPQGRPKFASFGGHVHAYDPAKSKNYKQLVRFWVTQHLKKIDGFKPYENALCVDLTFYLGIPTSWSKQKRIQASQGIVRPIGKRSNDADNLCKGVLDACTGLLWVDDAIITDLSVKKKIHCGIGKGCVKSDRALKMGEEDINKLAGSKLERALK